MGDGIESVGDERVALRRQATGVMLRAAALAAVLTAIVAALP